MLPALQLSNLSRPFSLLRNDMRVRHATVQIIAVDHHRTSFQIGSH
jgi:hypothetical protein